MFEEKDRIRTIIKISKSGNRHRFGVYPCKNCGKEIIRDNTGLKKNSCYCISCKNKIQNTKEEIVFESKICRICNKNKLFEEYSKRSRGKHFNSECDKCRHLKSKYKITSAEYDNLLEKQNNCCAICKNLETVKNGFRDCIDLSVDHDHKSGKVRGLLCQKCNRALGLFKDNENTLQNAVEYLKIHKYK